VTSRARARVSPKTATPPLVGIGTARGGGLGLRLDLANGCGRSKACPRFTRPAFTGAFIASGVTRDGAGAALGSCTVDLFEAHAPGDVPRWVGRTVSDGSGNFSFIVSSNATLYWARAVNGAGALAGVTLEFKAV